MDNWLERLKAFKLLESDITLARHLWIAFRLSIDAEIALTASFEGACSSRMRR